MHIFITGASGLLGRALVPLLQEGGHSVTGLARSDATRAMLHAMRVTPLAGQGNDVQQLYLALSGVDAIVHLATALPSDAEAIEDGWRHSDDVMVVLLRNLIAAGVRAGVRTYLFPSLYAVYGDHGDEWVSEDTPATPSPLLEAYARAEGLLHQAAEEYYVTGIVLRMGLVYSEDAQHTRGLLYGIKRGQVAVPGSDSTFWPMIHAVDAAAAMLLALRQAVGYAVLNVCDNEPVRSGQLYRDLSQWLGAPAPLDGALPGTGDLNPYHGRVRNTALRTSVRMSSRRIRDVLGFSPQFPTYREGFQAVIKAVQVG